LTAILAYFGFYDGVVILGGQPGVIQDYSNDIIYSEIYGISSSNLIYGVSCLGIIFLPYLNWKSWKKYLFLTLLASAVIISLKRIAIVSLVMALIYYLLIEKRRGNNVWLLVIPFLFLSIGTTYYDLISSRFTSISNTLSQSGLSDTSSQIRFDRFNLAWKNFLENPLLGQGSGYLAFVHNGFLEILGNLGLTGLVLFKPIVKPLVIFRKNFYNPWTVALIIFMITLVGLEAAINRIEIMYYLGLLYGGFLVSLKLNKNSSYE
jgi:O-antigen ligase